MTDIQSWGQDLITSESEDNKIALESFTNMISQGESDTSPHLYFKPVNIVVENGLYYVTLYVCKATNGTPLGQQVSIWLSSLKETDHIHLTVMTLINDVPLYALLDLMAAFSSTKAKVDIHLDQIVVDSLAYFYLIADSITKGSAGSLFIPSYVDQRDQDTSGPWRAMYDFYKWVVDEAVTRDILTSDEATKLHRGQYTIIPDDRFK